MGFDGKVAELFLDGFYEIDDLENISRELKIKILEYEYGENYLEDFSDCIFIDPLEVTDYKEKEDLDLIYENEVEEDLLWQLGLGHYLISGELIKDIRKEFENIIAKYKVKYSIASNELRIFWKGLGGKYIDIYNR